MSMPPALVLSPAQRGWDPALGVEAAAEAAPACPEGQLPVPGGFFLMGSTAPGAGRDEAPVHAVQVASFCLDRTELAGPDGLPVTPLTFEAARDACAARGARLPTEAEWEKAARGGCERGSDPNRCDPDDLAIHPWGNAVATCDRANHLQMGPGGPRPCEKGPLAVGGRSKGAGPYGHLDLSGNVWEWVADWYHPATWRRTPARVNPAGPAAGDIHVLRGGGWNTFSTNMRVANRFTSVLEGSATGVRCATGGELGEHDALAPYVTHRVEVQIEGADGETVFLSAFDARDLDSSGDRPLPGRSPVAERRLVVQPGLLPALQLPPGDFLLMVAVDAMSGIQAPTGPPRMGRARLEVTDALRESPWTVRVQLDSGPQNTPGSRP
jgi:formylglycine-generating enzyme required for sulfatase activity